MKLITKVNCGAFMESLQDFTGHHSLMKCLLSYGTAAALQSAPHYGRSETNSIFKSQTRLESLKASHDTD